MKIAHLSDPHFGTIRDGVEEALRNTIFAIKPDLILITGDITQRARASQFRAARKFAESLAPIDLIAVPGNHDIPLFNLPLRLLHPYQGFRHLFMKKTSKDYIKDGVKIYVLNSTDRWRHIQGEFRLDHLEKHVNDQPAGIEIKIAAFHHPMDCAKVVDEKNLLQRRDETMDIFARSGIDLIVGGHIHDPHVSLSRTRYPQIERSLILAVAGTCLSRRTRSGAGNSFNEIDIELTPQSPPRIRISRMDIGDDFRFHPVKTQVYTRDRNRNWSLEAP